MLLEGGLVDFFQGPVGVEDGMTVSVERKTASTTVPQATVEFVDGGFASDGITGVESVDQVIGHAHFASVSGGTDAISWGRVTEP